MMAERKKSLMEKNISFGYLFSFLPPVQSVFLFDFFKVISIFQWIGYKSIHKKFLFFISDFFLESLGEKK